MTDARLKQGATLVLVRHGETEGQSSIRYYGRTDLRLSEVGRMQMRAAGSTLRERKFDTVFASSLVRAQEGARIVAGHDRIVCIEDFIEIDFGLFEGLTAEEIQQRHPAEFAVWQSSRFEADYTYPHGESRVAFNSRIDRGLKRMLELWKSDAMAPSSTSLLVAHRGVIRAIIRSLTVTDPVVELGSISILEWDGAKWQPKVLDAVAHLEPPPP